MTMIKRLLLIDDDADERFLFRKALDELRSTINLFIATDGESAFETLKTIPLPDLIFLDLNMPKINGMQCLEKIKQTRQYASVPVIIYSTSFTPSDELKATKLGAAFLLKKPFSLSALCHELAGIFLIDWTTTTPPPLQA
jgi:CheY-like chemotaxis protein